MEKIVDAMKKACEWCKEHWKLLVTIVIVAVSIVLPVLALVLFLPVLAGVPFSVLLSAAFQVGLTVWREAAHS